jgi:hypothetical protein
MTTRMRIASLRFTSNYHDGDMRSFSLTECDSETLRLRDEGSKKRGIFIRSEASAKDIPTD